MLRYNLDGSFFDVFVGTGSSGLDYPAGLAFDNSGNLYVTSFNTDEIFVYDPSGAPLGDGLYVSVADNGGMDKPTHITFDNDGILYATDRATNSVLRFATDGSFLGPFGETGSSGLDLPIGPAVLATRWRPLRRGVHHLTKSSGLTDPRGALVEVVAGRRDRWRPDSPIDVIFDNNGSLYAGSYITDDVFRYGSESAAALEVSLSGPSTELVAVDYTTADGAAVAGSDYIATSGTLSFAPGETSKTIIVPTTDDGIVEDTESFVVNLSNPAGATLEDAQGVATILDTDGPLFSDSFENGEWDGKWVEDSQYDWFDSTQRKTDGSYSA